MDIQYIKDIFNGENAELFYQIGEKGRIENFST